MTDFERNPNPEPLRIQTLTKGDYVDVRFNQHPLKGFMGYVVRISADRLDLRVHETVGMGSSAPGCVGWNICIPMTSIAWIRHTAARPKACSCAEGLS